MANISSFEMLDAAIKKAGGKPTVLEALWDGDTQGWYLCLFLHSTTSRFFLPKTTRHNIGHITMGNDLRVFSGGGWPEAALAKELGEEAVARYGLIFYFPSDKEPDDDCPEWTKRSQAINCAGCNKLIIPTNSPYLPKDLCYKCHLDKEEQYKIEKEAPYDDGVRLYMVKDGVYEELGYSTHFDGFTIAPFVSDRVAPRMMNDGVNEVTLDTAVLADLKEKLEHELKLKLASYEQATIDEDDRRFHVIEKREYEHRVYELIVDINPGHRVISQLLHSLETLQRALLKGGRYVFFFKKGFTYRDDALLRFIYYECNGETVIADICGHFEKILTQTDIEQTLKKMEHAACLTINGSVISITQKGSHIL